MECIVEHLEGCGLHKFRLVKTRQIREHCHAVGAIPPAACIPDAGCLVIPVIERVKGSFSTRDGCLGRSRCSQERNEGNWELWSHSDGLWC